MFFDFQRNDELTAELKKRGCVVTDYFVEKTTIPLGYTFMSKYLQFSYCVKEHCVLLITFSVYKRDANSIGILRDFKSFIDIMRSISTLRMLVVLVNPYPKEEQKENQETFIKFGKKLGAEFVESSPVNLAILYLQRKKTDLSDIPDMSAIFGE